MAKKTNCKINGQDYYRLTKVVGHKLNANGIEVPIRKVFYGPSKSAAETKYQEYLKKKESGLETKTQYFGVLADDWIRLFLVNDGTLKDSSKHKYISSWNRYIKGQDFYGSPLNEITAKTLQQAYNNLADSGCPISELKTIHKLMRRFYRYIEDEALGRNVTNNLKIPKEKINASDETIITWSNDEIKRIFNGIENADNRFRLRFLIVLAYYTGCRKSELLALTYDDITDEGVRITKQLSVVSEGVEQGKDNKLKLKTKIAVTDPKTRNSVRTIPVDPVVYEELAKHKKWHLTEQMKNGYRTNSIFTTDSGSFYEAKNIDRALERFYRRAGVEAKPMHTYRHTYASNLCRNSVPIKTVAALLGHDSIETTARFYVSVDEDSKRSAALLLRRVIND